MQIETICNEPQKYISKESYFALRSGCETGLVFCKVRRKAVAEFLHPSLMEPPLTGQSGVQRLGISTKNEMQSKESELKEGNWG